MSAEQFATFHKERIRQYHRYWNLTFKPIPEQLIDDLLRDGKHRYHRSPAQEGDLAGSAYYIALVEGGVG